MPPESPAPKPPAPVYKYWAFISYSHRDKSWADWLHRGLETFAVPSRLIGRASRDGKVPARLFPVFRDREELPTSGNLGANLQEALRGSRYLIAVCSPHAAASRWVDQEIKAFKAMGREDRILCVIVDGEPNASDTPGGSQAECFAESLRYRIGPDGELKDERAEPIAADAREGQDGRENSLLKVAAGLLGVGFDELRQRDLERRRRRRAAIVGGVLALAAVLFWQEHAKVRQLSARLASVHYERAKALRESGDQASAALFFAESNRVHPSKAAGANAQYFVDQVAVPALVLGHSQVVVALAFSPDKKILAAAAADGAVRLWDPATGEALDGPGLEHELAARALAFSPDGTSLLVGNDHGTAAFWDTRARKRAAAAVLRHDGPVTAAAFSPDGALAATAGVDATARLWHARSGEPAGPALAHPEAVRAAAFSPDGKLLATACDDGAARLWSAATGKPAGAPLKHGSPVLAAAFSPDGRSLVTMTADHAYWTWETRTGKLAGEPLRHDAGLRLLAAAADGAVAVGIDGSARLWDRRLARPLGPLLRHEGAVFSAALSGDGSLVATGGSDYAVRVWTASRGAPAEASLGALHGIAAAAFSPDGSRLTAAVAGSGPTTPLWDWDSRSAEPVGEVPSWELAALSRAGEVVVTASGTAVAVTRLGERPLTLRPRGQVELIAVSAEGRHAVTVSQTNRQRAYQFWNAEEGALIDEFSGRGANPFLAVALSPGGSMALIDYATDDGNKAELIAAYSHRVLAPLLEQEQAVSVAAFSHDSRVALTAGEDGVARLWNVPSGTRRGRPLRQGAPIRHAAFSRDSSVVSLSGETLPARLWDAGEGEPLGGPLGEPGAAIKALSFDPAASRLLAVTPAGKILSWDVSWAFVQAPPRDIAAAARLAASRRLDERGEPEPLEGQEKAALLRVLRAGAPK